MKIFPRLPSLCLIAALSCMPSGSVAADPPPGASPGAASPRTTVFISDTHLGVGRTADGTWDKHEDFRWRNALRGFLGYWSKNKEGPIDLVILGDFVELWQYPVGRGCAGSAALGCTTEEALALTSNVATQHAAELQDLKAFSETPGNRLFIVPGNHDAGTLVPSVWKPLGDALGAKVTFVKEGIWRSEDGVIVAEHGHQIGKDLNRFDNWPKVAADTVPQQLIRPWGERFVQKIFNDQEEIYPIIDNLSPESATLKYRLADRGLGLTALDIARFIAFNLFDTSFRQKLDLLGDKPQDADGVVHWNIAAARGFGATLFADALPSGDPARAYLLGEDGAAVREELAAMTVAGGAMSDDDILQLCTHVEIQREAAPQTERVSCVQKTQGALAQALFHTKADVIKAHLAIRAKQNRNMRIFIYGHTHQLETPWSVDVPKFASVNVANTGAFHRTLQESAFSKLLRRPGTKITQDAALKQSPEVLPACYSFVLVTRERKMSALRWHQAEDSEGKVVSVPSSECPYDESGK